MITVYYLDNSEDFFDITKKSDIDRFRNMKNTPTRIVLSSYELSIVSNWKNIPITNNLACAWTGDMALFIVVNLMTTMNMWESSENLSEYK